MVRLAALAAAAILGGCSGEQQPARSQAPGDTGRGAVLYANYCASCHLADGRAVANLRPALAGSALIGGDPAALARWVMYGERAPGAPASLYPPVMPQFYRLSDADLAALLSELRARFSPAAGAVGPDTIRAVRAAHP